MPRRRAVSVYDDIRRMVADFDLRPGKYFRLDQVYAWFDKHDPERGRDVVRKFLKTFCTNLPSRDKYNAAAEGEIDLLVLRDPDQRMWNDTTEFRVFDRGKDRVIYPGNRASRPRSRKLAGHARERASKGTSRSRVASPREKPPSGENREKAALLEPEKLFSWSELRSDEERPPKSSGLYAWYFDQAPGEAPLKECHSFGRWKLLYIGISPATSGSKSTIRDRIRYHFRGNCSGSTFRLTLASLLHEELGLKLRRTELGRSLKLSSSDEGRLDEWLGRHARVCWVVRDAPWVLEERLIPEVSPPLNIDHNQASPFRRRLMELRKAFRVSADQWDPIGASASDRGCRPNR